MRLARIAVIVLLGIVLVSTIGCGSSSNHSSTATPTHTDTVMNTPTTIPTTTPTPIATPTSIPTPTLEPTPMPTLAPIESIEILEHHLVVEDQGGMFSMTFVRGTVQNNGDVTLAAIYVKVLVSYKVEGLGDEVFTMPGSISIDPAAFQPGEVRPFEVLLQNGAKEDYSIAASISPH